MSVLTVSSISVLKNPAPFTSPLEFEVHYEAIQDLEDDVEWRMVYIGSADDKSFDQELESVMVGPVRTGKYKFVFQADPPDPTKIPKEDLVGLTAVLLCCFYKDQEFLRVGYYVQVDFEDENLKDDPPSNPQIEQLQRNVLDADPRITHYAIDWPKHLQIPEVAYPEVTVQDEHINEPIDLVSEQNEDATEEKVDDEGDAAQAEDDPGAHHATLDSGTETGLEVELLG